MQLSLNPVSIRTSSVSNHDQHKKQSPNFKGFGSFIANAPSALSEVIESGGFVTSFLVQDTLGMTAPRSREGFYRNRPKKTPFKKLNFKEGFEVFIREFFSGILMMMAPFAAFALTKKFVGKASFMNTDMIKKLGKGFTESVGAKQANATSQEVKKGFYRNIVSKMVKGSNPNVADASKHENVINSISSHIENLDSLEQQLKVAKGNSFMTKLKNVFKSKANKTVSEKQQIKTQIKETNAKIVSELNDYHMSNSSDFELLNRVDIDGQAFKISDTVNSMRGYMQDAAKSKDLAQYTVASAENLGKVSMTKRVLSTIGAALATIGATSIVPKMYSMLNPVSPGISEEGGSSLAGNENLNPFQKKNNVNKNTSKVNNKEQQNNAKTGNVSFKGNVLKTLQFDGNQLTPLLMSVIAAGGLIGPRINTAIKRAPVEENGEKNLIEVPEIITRDVVSTSTVIFAVPMLTKGVVGSYQNKSGFVLMNDNKKNGVFKKVLDTLNPLSPVSTLATDDLHQIYGNFDSKAKFTNFAEYINNNEGHLAKVLKPLPEAKELFGSANIDLKELAKQDKKSANAKIMTAIADHFDDAKTKKLFAPKKGQKYNEMFLKARRLSGTPKAVATLVLVPYFLGFVLPKFVYKVTAQNKAKHEQKMAEYRKNKALENAKTNTGSTSSQTKTVVPTAPVQGAPVPVASSFSSLAAFDKIKTHKS